MKFALFLALTKSVLEGEDRAMNRLTACADCFRLEDELEKKIIQGVPIFSSGSRGLFFAPCGNHHLFGLFNDRRTPKIVIMGITTSPDAKENFRETFKRYRGAGISFDEALRRSCIANCFNSKRPTLQQRLSKIIGLSGLLKIIGVEKPVEITNSLFSSYVNDRCSDDERKVVENIYFSQAILCCSYALDGGSGAPAKSDIDEHHKKCIRAQVDIIKSFDSNVHFWISFGRSDAVTLSSQACFEAAERQDEVRSRCDRYRRIDHPASGRGWNLLPLFEEILRESPNIERQEFVRRVKEQLQGKPCNYQTMVSNCAQQLMELRDIAGNPL